MPMKNNSDVYLKTFGGEGREERGGGFYCPQTILFFKNGGHLSTHARKEPPGSKTEAAVEGRSWKDLV